MRLEIELDMSKIDYEAINKQVQDKIAAMDLEESYRISSTIKSQIQEQTERKVNLYLQGGSWSCLNDDSKREIKDEISKNIRELIKPHVEGIFYKIPQEELDAIISELLPQVLTDMLVKHMQTMVSNFYYSYDSRLMNICDDMIRNALGRVVY